MERLSLLRCLIAKRFYMLSLYSHMSLLIMSRACFFYSYN